MKPDRPETLCDLHDLGYDYARLMEDGTWLAIQRMIFYWALTVVEDSTTWRTYYSYNNLADALVAMTTWDGKGDPPGPWMKQKPEDRWNPALPKPE